MAFDLFKDRVLNYIGSYHLKLDGKVDALVFSGGIGERSVELRNAIGARLECLGYSGVGSANEDADHKEGVVIDVSRGHPETKRILICRTDEQVGVFIQPYKLQFTQLKRLYSSKWQGSVRKVTSSGSVCLPICCNTPYFAVYYCIDR